MSIFRRALGLESRSVPLPYIGDNSFYGADPYGYTGTGIPSPNWMPTTSTGTVVTELSALQLSAFYGCVRLLADAIASLDWVSYKANADAPLLMKPQPSILRQPCPGMTNFDWKYVLITSLAIRGNFFGLVTERDALQYPASIVPLHPDWVVVHRDASSGALWYTVNGQRYEPADIFHVRWFTLPGYDVGLSPVSVFRQAIGLGLAAEDFGGKWFRDGAAPSSVLSTDQTLTDDQIKQTQQQWVATHGGRRRPAILSGGFKWDAITISPEESQFLETRKFQVSEIARMFGVPPHMIGDVDRSTSWGTGIEQMSVGFLRFTLMPWLERIEAALDQITPRSQFVKFDVKQLLRGDVATRYTAYKMAIEAGWMNPDEVRAEEDLSPIPGGAGQGYRQPLNFGPLGTVPEPKPAPASPETPTTPSTPASSADPSS